MSEKHFKWALACIACVALPLLAYTTTMSVLIMRAAQ